MKNVEFEAWRFDSLDQLKNNIERLLFVCSSIQLARVRGLCVYTQFSISLTIKTEQIIYEQKITSNESLNGANIM